MKLILSILAAALLTTGCITGPQTHVKRLPSGERVKQSVEERLVSGNVLFDSPNSAGSGVLVKHNGELYALTAAHVAVHLDESFEARVRVFDQGVIDLRVTGSVERVIALDESLALALVKLKLQDSGYCTFKVSRRTLELGQDLLSCGNLLGPEMPWNVTRGKVSQYPGESAAPRPWSWPWENGNYIGADLSAGPGCSGAGVFTADGRLVGILVGGQVNGYAAIVHNDVIARFAKEWGVEWILED